MTKIVSIIIFLFSFSGYSQTKIIKTFFTKDSLTEITLLNNNKVGYIKYSGTSPMITKHRVSKTQGKSRCPGMYIVADQAYGKYEIKNDDLLLQFIEHKLDSVTVEYLPTEENENLITVTFSGKYEIPEDFFPVDLYVKQEDNGAVINNLRSENGQIKIKLPKTSLPKVFIINNSQRIIIDKFRNQNIIYLKNYYKEFSSGTVGERQFKISELLIEK